MSQQDFVRHAKSGATIFSGTAEECKDYLRQQAPAQRTRLYVIHTEHISVDEYLHN